MRERRIDLAAIESRLRSALHDSLRLVCEVGSGGRISEHILGRLALTTLCARLGDRYDPVMLRFPHPSVSLTHTGGYALALGLSATDAPGPCGIGIDLEWDRPVRAEAARFFLSESERDGLEPSEILRLWTVKEALFKAHPRNDETLLHQYRINKPTAFHGTARAPDGSLTSWVSLRIPGGFIAAALSKGDSPDAR